MRGVESIIEKYNYDASQLISVLHDTQLKYNFLAKEALEIISEKLRIPLADVYQVATFYKAFSLEPRGKHIVKVCLGTACHVRGAQRIKESLERELGIESNGMTKDKLFSLESVNCLGCCALGPVIVVDNDYYGNMNPGKLKKIIKKYG
ncbi:MAG: NAD(P)H-dependent oxidoreductase subunit E [Promethearchaeota archaeon]